MKVQIYTKKLLHEDPISRRVTFARGVTFGRRHFSRVTILHERKIDKNTKILIKELPIKG